jgi:hypothetical protein
MQNEPNLPTPDRQAGPWLEAIMRNEPNFEGRLCKTNPIRADAAWDGAPGAMGRGAIVRNKANWGIDE